MMNLAMVNYSFDTFMTGFEPTPLRLYENACSKKLEKPAGLGLPPDPFSSNDVESKKN